MSFVLSEKFSTTVEEKANMQEVRFDYKSFVKQLDLSLSSLTLLFIVCLIVVFSLFYFKYFTSVILLLGLLISSLVLFCFSILYVFKKTFINYVLHRIATR